MIKIFKLIIQTTLYLFLIIYLHSETNANIFSKLKKFQTLEADFIQEKQVSILQNKIILTGKVKIKKPDNILWETVSPISQKIIVKKNTVIIIDDNSTNEYSLKTTPFMKDFLSIFIDLINNNMKNLQNNFQLQIISSDPLIIELIPKQEFISENVTKIILKTKDNSINEILMQEKNGDYLKIIFKNAIFNQQISSQHFNQNR